MLQSAYRELATLITEPKYAELHDAHYAIAFCESALGSVFTADQHIRKAIELVGTTGSVTQLSRDYNGLGVISLQLCKATEAKDAFDKALQLANKIGDDSRASAIAANTCTCLTLMGSYGEALAIGKHAVDRGIRVPNQPLFATTYSNMVDAYVLMGKTEEARSCLNMAKEWFRQERSFFARQALLVEATNLALMIGTVEDFLDAFEALERDRNGRGLCFLHRSVTFKFAARRDAVLGKATEAMEVIEELVDKCRRDCPLALVDALAAKTWLETLTSGRSNSRAELLQLLNRSELFGKRATLEREGFLGERPCP
jgi:pentatricopeptide repeat protein